MLAKVCTIPLFLISLRLRGDLLQCRHVTDLGLHRVQGLGHFVDLGLGSGFELGRRIWGRGSAGFMVDSGLRLLAILLLLGN